MNITSLTWPYNPADAVLRYDTNMDALMRRDLDTNMTKFYNTITVNFWFYSDTGDSDAKQQGTNEGPGYDFLNLVYYTGTADAVVRNVVWTDTEAQAKAKAWTEVSVVIPQNSIKIAFEFVSGTTPPVGGDAPNAFSAFGVRTVPQGSTGMKEGVYIDDITVVGSDPVVDGEMVTNVLPMSAYQTSRSFQVNWDDHNALYVPVQYAYLYYRVDGGQWAKYVNDVKPQGGFLPDLYDRLAFEVVRVPPLRERQGDVRALARHFLTEFLKEVPALGEKTWDEAALAALERYPFPGNVRELKTIVERAAYRDTTREINLEDLALPVAGATHSGTFRERVEGFERQLIRDALGASAGNQADAARRLGLAYHRFRYYARKYRS
jgi:hypothetical protein